MCLSCAAWCQHRICGECRSLLRCPAPISCGGVLVTSGLVHEKVARRLVHLLKYQAITSAAVVLGSIMASRLPATATALVPVPRARVRRVRYGVDPAIELARQVRMATGLEIVHAIGAPLWWPSHAGSDRASRQPPVFRRLRTAPVGSVLVDDVVTTGSTLAAASELSGLVTAITATRAEVPMLE